MNPRPEYSIVVPVFNQLESTKKCLNSIVQQSQNYDYELIVVANGCTDGTEEWLIKEFASNLRTVVVSYPKPLGGGEAINVGLRLCKGLYNLTLNNDCIILAPTWIDLLREPFRSDSHMGITGPLELYSPEIADTFIVFFCTMIRREVIQNIGLLDTETFQTGFGEDMDFCKRAKLAGWHTGKVPKEELSSAEGRWAGAFPIFHAGGVTVHTLSNWKEIIERNKTLLRERYGT